MPGRVEALSRRLRFTYPGARKFPSAAPIRTQTPTHVPFFPDDPPSSPPPVRTRLKGAEPLFFVNEIFASLQGEGAWTGRRRSSCVCRGASAAAPTATRSTRGSWVNPTAKSSTSPPRRRTRRATRRRPRTNSSASSRRTSRRSRTCLHGRGNCSSLISPGFPSGCSRPAAPSASRRAGRSSPALPKVPG